ncbi:MAG TPA: archaemetzincin [Ignavibacteriaceae bacterium]|nr:archaemetzincin [Ignavibacteriaceae bacterium]
MQDINIVPVHISNADLVQKIIYELSKIFPGKVKKIGIDISVRESYSPDRRQYFSTRVLAEAVKHTSSIKGKVLILVSFDLYVPVFTFVFGEAQLNGKHSIVSLCRLHEEFYTGKTNTELLFSRTIKEILHELGHNFGLLHCSNWDCVMHSSAIIEEVDIKGDNYCPDCMKIIRANNENELSFS